MELSDLNTRIKARATESEGFEHYHVLFLDSSPKKFGCVVNNNVLLARIEGHSLYSGSE